MYSLDRYEFSATDSLYEKVDAKIGNFLVRSEEKAEARHRTFMQKQREKYAKAKARADAAEAAYKAHAEKVGRVSNFHNYDSNCRVIDI